MKKATRPKENPKKQSSPSQADFTIISPADAPSKISRILASLLHGRSLNRFEAERLGDHCLHSTISKLSNDYGLLFVRMSERVPNNWGRACGVTRYSLPASQNTRACHVLAMLCSTAGARREVAA